MTGESFARHESGKRVQSADTVRRDQLGAPVHEPAQQFDTRTMALQPRVVALGDRGANAASNLGGAEW